LVLTLNIFGYGQQKDGNTQITNATSLLQKGKIDEAVKILDKVIQINPKNVAALNLRGWAKLFAKDFNGALADFNKVITLAPNAIGIEKVYNDRGTIFDFLGEREKALADYNKAISINPNYPQPYNGRANILSAKGDLDKAFLDYDKAIKLDPKLMPPYDGRAYIYFVRGDFDKSLDDLDKALEIIPNNAGSILQRGIVLGLKGYWFAAADSLKKAVEINSDSSAFSGNIATSLSDLDKYILINSKNAKVFAVRALIKLLQKKESESVEDFKKAFELDPNLQKDLDTLIEPVRAKLNN